jgi:hypothetical protein
MHASCRYEATSLFKTMIKKAFILFVLLEAGLTAQAEPFHFSPGPYSAAERALLKQNLIVELYRPEEPSGHMLGNISGANGKGGPAVLINFGREDAAAAREEGRSMASFHYTEAQAEQFLFAQGWDKYHHDRFFTRAYVQEGLAAFGGR